MASIIKIGGRWRALIRRKGHPAHCKTFGTKALAEAWARRIESEIDRGRAISPDSIAGRAVTVADLIDAYRELRDQSRPIDDKSSEHYMLKSLRAGLGDHDISRMTPQHLAAYCAQRRDEGAGPYTCNMEVSKLGTALKYGSVMLKMSVPDIVGQSRALLTHIGAIGGGGRRERRPTEDELARIVEHLRTTRGEIYADVVLFAVGSAMRRGEIVGLLWSDIDAERRLALVRDRKDPRRKSGNDQRVPLLPAAWEVVERRRQHGGDRVFPVHESTTSKYFTWACRDLAIPDLHFHDLRHEGVSRLFEDGYSIEQVALVSGHKSWAMLRRYTQLRPESLHRSGGSSGVSAPVEVVGDIPVVGPRLPDVGVGGDPE